MGYVRDLWAWPDQSVRLNIQTLQGSITLMCSDLRDVVTRSPGSTHWQSSGGFFILFLSLAYSLLASLRRNALVVELGRALIESGGLVLDQSQPKQLLKSSSLTIRKVFFARPRNFFLTMKLGLIFRIPLVTHAGIIPCVWQQNRRPVSCLTAEQS